MNSNNVQITVTTFSHPIPGHIVVAIYCSKTVKMTKFIDTLHYFHDQIGSSSRVPTVILGDFNINLIKLSSEQKALTKYLIDEKGYTQLINEFTTGYRTQIDHIYTNVPHLVQSAGALESYYSDHKPIFVSLKPM